MTLDKKQIKLLAYGCLSATLLFIIVTTFVQCACGFREKRLKSRHTHTLTVRELPSSFPGETHMPNIGEGKASGSIDLSTFSAGRDLIYLESNDAWWESDHDSGDTEDDHSMHKAMKIPLMRVIEMTRLKEGILKIQDAYRPEGIHNPTSLHKEGRAVDLTCDQFPLEELAKLCWAAGFDWVLYEAGNGAHIHASVKRGEF